MEIPAAIVILPMGILFLVSGLIVNLIQALCYVVFRPFSRRLYRMINVKVVELLWLEIVWLVDWWGHFKIKFYADPETFEAMGKEHAIFICNHKSDVDWLLGWVLSQRSGCVGGSLAIMKKSLLLMPIVGWSLFFSGSVFLERSWQRDEKTLKSGLQKLEDYPSPFWLALFVEGTRFTQDKLLAAQDFAMSKGLPVPKNVLVPRTKGFVSTVKLVREFVPAIYDGTVAIPENQPPPTLLRLLKRQPSEIHVHLKRHSVLDLPQTEAELEQWCRNAFVEKDLLLDKHKFEGTFGEEIFQPLGRPYNSLVVVVMWICIIIVGAYFLLKWTSILSSWVGVLSVASVLLLIIIAMQIIIMFTQSERSTRSRAAAAAAQSQNEARLPLLV